MRARRDVEFGRMFCALDEPMQCRIQPGVMGSVESVDGDFSPRWVEQTLNPYREALVSGDATVEGSERFFCLRRGSSLRCFDGSDPQRPIERNDVVESRVSAWHVCARVTSGAVVCAGDPTFGRVDGRRCAAVDAPRAVTVSSRAIAFATGRSLVCALRMSDSGAREVQCSGDPVFMPSECSAITSWPGPTVIAAATSATRIAVSIGYVWWTHDDRSFVLGDPARAVSREELRGRVEEVFCGVSSRGVTCDGPTIEPFRSLPSVRVRRSSLVTNNRWSVCVRDGSEVQCVGFYSGRVRVIRGVRALRVGREGVCAQRSQPGAVTCWRDADFFDGGSGTTVSVPEGFRLRASLSTSFCGTDEQGFVHCSRDGGPLRAVDGAQVNVEQADQSLSIEPTFVCWLNAQGALQCAGHDERCAVEPERSAPGFVHVAPLEATGDGVQ